MSKVILLVFEGAKPEASIYNSLREHFFNDDDRTIVYATFNTVIYKLYKGLQKYDGLDFDLIEELKLNNANIPDGIVRKNVAEIYLIFDYDGHATNASDEKLKEMLKYFDNETENGKLYISYPMVEAIKHLKSGISFHETIAEAKKDTQYKKRVNRECDECYKNYSQWNKDNWVIIIQEHCKKLNFLVTDSFSFPEKVFEQLEIFEAQLEKYINPSNQVSVLSAFPVMLLDYYGMKTLINKINPQYLSSS